MRSLLFVVLFVYPLCTSCSLSWLRKKFTTEGTEFFFTEYIEKKTQNSFHSVK